MPGRVAGRSARSTAQPSNTTTTSNARLNIPDEGLSTSLRQEVCAVFAGAQKTATGHRKLAVSLRKIQEACCYEPANPRKNASQEEDFDENDFNLEIGRSIVRILGIKRSEGAGDKIVRFVGLFLKHAMALDNAIFQEEAEATGVFPETPSSRLTSYIVSLLLPLLPAKDKIVRFRCTQIIAHLINTLDSVDDELFHFVRLGLLRRLRDKESAVRVQAVYGLGRLAGELDPNQDDEDSDEDEVAGGVLGKLLDILQNDPSAEVRRSLLLNLPFTPSTLPYLLERARDLEPGIRRALYSRLLPALADFRHLSLTHREKLLRWGLRDRDENVRKATAKLFRERWIEDCAAPRNEEGVIETKPGQLSAPSSEGLLELLERIDVVNAGVDGGIAIDAMKEFWDGRPDYRDHITFDEAYWKDLTPESIFIARTFNDFCKQNDVSARLEDKMPEVSRFAYLLQSNINTLVESVQRIAQQEEAEEDSVYQEFIVEQLLYIALTLDYSDEMGRRTMYSLMREALALAELPEETTRLVVEVLRTACGTNVVAERDFCAVVVEAIAEVHDNIMGDDSPKEDEERDDSFHSARSELSDSTPKKSTGNEVDDEEKAVREILVNMKCLHIAQCMLQNVECGLEQNVHLVTMLNNLVVPAVRSQEAPVRERGLLCLGLCCLLDKNLSEENLNLFLMCYTKGHEALQNIAIQVIADILTAHPSLLLTSPIVEGQEPAENPLHKLISKMFSKSLKSGTMSIQSTACTALCKLMLSSPSTTSGGSISILNSDDMLRLLTICYFNPETAGNPALRQMLTYFIPVYCHSRKENMERMGRIALSVLQWCTGMKEELDVEGEEDATNDMVGISIVIAHLSDWTDGRKLAAALNNISDENVKDADGNVHIQLAEDVMKKVLGGCSKDERKILISLLGKLYITPNCDQEKLQFVYKLVDEAVDDNIGADATTRNTLAKVRNAVWKASGTDADPSRSRGTSRAPSLAPSVAGDDNDEGTVLDVDENQGSVLEPVSTTTTPATSPEKAARGRKAAATSRGKRHVEPVTEAEGDKEEEGEEESEPTPAAPKSRPLVAILTKPTQSRPRTNITASRSAPVLEPSSESSSFVEDDEEADESTLRAASPSVCQQQDPILLAPRRSAVARPEPVIKAEPMDDDGDVDMVDADTIVVAPPPQPAPPTKKPRGRPPKQPAAAPARELNSETQEHVEVAAPKSTAMPARESVPPRPVRKSVRANRRATAASEASFSEM